MINTEKGLLHLDLSGEYTCEGLKVKEINVGELANVVPGLASALVEARERPLREDGTEQRGR